MAVKRITIRLSGDEYAALEAEATRERRTVAQQAAYRITRPSLIQAQPVMGSVGPGWSVVTAGMDGNSTLRGWQPNSNTYILGD